MKMRIFNSLEHKKTALGYKALFIFTGILLALGCAELTLRTAGYLYIARQEYHNRLNLGKWGIYRILCIGESTTQEQYPAFLEEELNRKYPAIRFKVIDKGLGGSNTNIIREALPENIERFKPDMIVAMMGTNDTSYNLVCEKKSFIEKLKLYKLARYLFPDFRNEKAQVLTDMEPEQPPSPGIDTGNDPSAAFLSEVQQRLKKNGFIDVAEKELLAYDEKHPGSGYVPTGLARIYFQRGQAWLALEILEKACLSGKGRNPVYRSIAEVYLNFGRAEIAKKVIDEYLPDTALNDREKYWKYFNLGVIACQLYDFPGALSNYERAAAYAPNEGYLYAKRGEMLGKLGRINEGRRSFEKALELSRGNRLILRMAATFYLETGDTRLSDEYFRQLEDPRTYLCKQLTKQNYSAVVKLADERGISMVCMEYPTRNITSLKEMLDYNPKLLFVDNEALFKNAVRKYGYDVIFRDKFGISFGHCTDKGNRLLAENLSDRILERFFYSTDPARIRI